MREKTCPMCGGNGVIAVPFGERIRETRERLNLTQDQVASSMGLSRPSLVNIEADRQNVSTDKVAAFARLFDVSADYLLGLKDRPND